VTLDSSVTGATEMAFSNDGSSCRRPRRIRRRGRVDAARRQGPEDRLRSLHRWRLDPLDSDTIILDAGRYVGGADQYPCTYRTITRRLRSLQRFRARGVERLLREGQVDRRHGAAPTTNRGFTWNPSTRKWVQERDAWTVFPTVTTIPRAL